MYRDLYEKMWGEGYKLCERSHSNSYGQVKEVLDPKGSLADWGCGQGRVLQMFKNDGLDVIGIDIASNCLDDDIDIEFICSEIKDAYMPNVDYSMCFDVLEHIEEEEIPASIANIMEHTNHNVLFKVFMGPSYKEIAGEYIDVHVTQQDEQWWMKQFWGYKVLWHHCNRQYMMSYFLVTHE